MSIREYLCSSCSHQFEIIQKMNEKPLTTCPACGYNTLVKLISAAGFRLKGGGWYSSDFKTPMKPPTIVETPPNITKEPKLT